MMRKYGLSILAVLLVGFTGCASISVSNKKETPGIPLSTPKKLYVVDFSTPETSFQVDRKNEELKKFQKVISKELTKETRLRLDKYVLPTEEVKSIADLPHGVDAWAVIGRFENVRQGSRAMRVLVGLGAGRTTLVTLVALCDLSGNSPQAILTFNTTGGSNLEGGIVLPLVTAPFAPPVAVAAAIPLASSAASVSMNAAGGAAGLNMDIKRTARQISAVVSDTAFKHGVKTKKRHMRPKSLSSVEPLQMPTWAQ